MTEREAFEMREKIRRQADSQGWICPVCKRNLNGDGAVAQWAHRIPQSQVKVYGKDIIHHPLNGVVVCSLACNQAVSVRNEPLWEAQMVAAIREAIKEGR